MLVPLVLIVVLSSVVFLFIQRQYSYWQRHKIPFIKPKFPFGSISAPGTNKTIGEQFAVFYENHRRSDHAFVGIYASVTPVALLIDLELIGRVLIRDFDCFQNRGKYYNEKDPLSETLVNVDHAKWKPLREKCSKVFTPLKMRYMFPTMVTVCDRLVDCLSKMIKTDSEVEVHNLFARCVTDTIGNCAFGIDVDSLEDPAVKFRQMAKKAYDEPKLSFLQLSCVSTFPKLARFFDVREQHKDVADYFSNIVRKTMQYRETNDIRRNDFMDILMQMRNRSSKKESENFTMTEIAAQAYTFITVGFEGPSLTLAYCLYELSLDKNKHIQEKAGAEIESVLKRHNGNLTYEAVAEMAYCERIVKESLRKYPPASVIPRIATKSYDVRMGSTNFTIPEGMFVLIPIYAIHRDPTYYPEPEEFIPERFTPEEIQKRPPLSYLPFADGPRKCIAMRFAMTQIQLGLICLLRNFEFSTCTRTAIPMEFCPTKLPLSPKSDVWLNVKQIT